jgi:hypothetical protein
VPVNDEIKDEIKDVDEVASDTVAIDEKQGEESVQPSRRVSPRLASVTHVEPPNQPQQKAKRRKYRYAKVRRMVTYYLVEWELPNDEIQTSWEPQDSLVRQGLQEFIVDYERRQLEAATDLELGLMFTHG